MSQGRRAASPLALGAAVACQGDNEMSYSDDPASPATPFSGDETGEIFQAPDLVLDSPTTSERFVETQSGFLVVVKQQEDKQALSVKRQLGTPPTSSVVLTPDESVKLSRILSGSPAARPRAPAARAEHWLAAQQLAGQPAGRVEGKFKQAARGIVLPVLLSILLGISIAYLAQSARLPGRKVLVSAPADPLEARRLDALLRGFVLNLLDFNPDTYKVSQVRAMAQMSPELMRSYWQDTHFPLTARQLKALAQGTTVTIEQVTPQRLDARTIQADVYANLVRAGSGARNPIHLRLQVELDAEGNPRITEQKDVTAGPPQR